MKIEDTPLYLFEKIYEKDPVNNFAKSVESFYARNHFITPKQIQALKNIADALHRIKRKRFLNGFDVDGFGYGLMAGISREYNSDKEDDFDDCYDYYGIPNSY